jgi:DUF1680 family protein
MQAHPSVEETRNQVAIMSGPLVYSLESIDLPDGRRFSEVRLPRDARLASFTEAGGAVNGMTLLEATAAWRVADHGFDAPLYREVPDQPLQETELTVIPYFAWANRGASEMSVWLPLAS